MTSPTRAWTAGLILCTLAGCSHGPTTPTLVVPSPSPTPTVQACSPWPDTAAVQGMSSAPGASQEISCRSNEPPRFERVVARRRAAGVEVVYDLLDDSGSVCDVVHMNGRWRGAACGGTGQALTSFSNNQTFPVQVRLVAWDAKGCLALPYCVTVQ